MAESSQYLGIILKQIQATLQMVIYTNLIGCNQSLNSIAQIIWRVQNNYQTLKMNQEEYIHPHKTTQEEYPSSFMDDYSLPFYGQSQEELSLSHSSSPLEKPQFLRHIFEKEQLSNQIPDLSLQQWEPEFNLLTPSREQSADSVLPSFLIPNISKKSSYLEETRIDKLRRYQRKKCERRWKNKTIYDCRKEIANARQRLRGRFAKKDQASHQNKREDETGIWSGFVPIESFFQHIKEQQEF